MNTVTHSGEFEAACPADELFPLFSPEGEKLWTPGWDYDNIMGTAALAEDYVFLTKTHDHRAADAIWIVKKYDASLRVIELYKIEPGEKVGVVAVQCEAVDSSRTRVVVSYKYIALSPSGEQFIAGFTAAAFSEFIGEWRELLSAYLNAGGEQR